VLTIKASRYGDWYYILATPEDKYWKTFRYTNMLFIALFIVSLFLGILTALFLLKRNYRPLKSIMHMLGQVSSNKNEYELIAALYNQINSENISQMRERYILSRLKGRKPTFATTDINNYYQIANRGKTYCLAVFSIEDTNWNGINGLNEDQNEDLNSKELLLFALNNVVTEVLNKYDFYKVEDGWNLFYLLYLDESELARWKSERLEIAKFIKDFFRDQLSASIQIAISDFANDFELVNKLYENTMQMLKYKSITGYEDIILIENYKWMIEDATTYKSMHWSSKILDAIKNGNYSQIREVTDSFFMQRTSEDSLILPIFRFELNECLHNVMNTFHDIMTKDEIHHMFANKIIKLISENDIENMKKIFLDILYYVCDTVTVNNGDDTNRLIYNIRQYIINNYADYNLNINSIAERFSRNPNYLAQMYYNQTGQRLLDTIHEVRIQYAKNLLQNPSFTIKQVAQEVGFGSVRTFMRAFEKYCGIKPSQYKSQYTI